MFLSERRLVPERMDTACRYFGEYRTCLADLAAVNRVTFTHGPTLAWLARAAADRPSFTLLDVACGQGDLLRGVRRWANRTGKTARLIGLDVYAWSIAAAREATSTDDAIEYAHADVFNWTPDGPIDFITSSQFLHHLTDEQAIEFLRWQERHAARGWIVADLVRSRIAYFGFPLLARVARWHPLVRTDGQISIGRGWRPRELAALASAAGVPAVARTHGPFRLTLSRLREQS